MALSGSAAGRVRETAIHDDAHAPAVDVRPASSRAGTRTSWLDSRHSFAFGSHRDPGNTHHGLLLVHNEDTVAAGRGFDTHPHRDMEIVTWVLSGSLVHQDSAGHNGVIYPGLAQRMSAGRGIRHSERNDSWSDSGSDSSSADGARGAPPVHFLQMWVLPDEPGLTPGYEQREIPPAALEGALVAVASGLPGHADSGAIRIHNRYAALHAARLTAGQSVVLPDAPLLHLFQARGASILEDAAPLQAGDAARLSGAGPRRVTATTTGEILVWEMHAALARPRADRH